LLLLVLLSILHVSNIRSSVSTILLKCCGFALDQVPEAMKKIAKVISRTVDENNFDGIVLELWSQFGGQMRPQVARLVSEIAGELRHAGRIFVLVIPPATNGRMFEKSDFDTLVDSVDFFSLMTYDYSNPQRPGTE
jgi:chitinase domain-containing protein 1